MKDVINIIRHHIGHHHTDHHHIGLTLQNQDRNASILAETAEIPAKRRSIIEKQVTISCDTFNDTPPFYIVLVTCLSHT